MRTANERKLKRDALSIKKIQTVEGDQLAVKQDRSPPPSAKNTISDVKHLEQFLGIDASKGGSSGEHPFDLSYVHSQIADYPDFSEDDAIIKQMKTQGILEDKELKEYEDLSAIASDSSFAQKLQPQMIIDSDDDAMKQGEESPSKSVRRRNNTKRNMNQTGISTQVANEATRGPDQMLMDQQSQLTLDERLSTNKKKKKKKGAAGKVNKVAAEGSAPDQHYDLQEKYRTFKTLIRNMESEFIDNQKTKDPYSYINKKTHKIEINPGMPYRSTSMDEILELRN